MELYRIATITNENITQSFETMTDNNYHNDTSILNCYLAMGLVPYGAPEWDKLWKILDRLKEIDRKSYIQGFLRFEDLENRSKLDKELEKIVKKYVKG